MTISNREQAYVNDFATRSFRDIADQDYITARIAYRRELDHQFRWCSLQAIEKYLKAILIYNLIPAKGIGHNLSDALTRVKSIPDLGFHLPSSKIVDFIDNISWLGADRYLSHPTYLIPGALLLLDKTIWYVRRYCFFMRETTKQNGKIVDLFEFNKKQATNPEFETKPHKYQLKNGFLEKVIRNRLPAYDDLIWKNFFYGRSKKQSLRNFRDRGSSNNPTHDINPQIFPVLAKLVDFPRKVKDMYGKTT